MNGLCEVIAAWLSWCWNEQVCQGVECKVCQWVECEVFQGVECKVFQEVECKVTGVPGDGV